MSSACPPRRNTAASTSRRNQAVIHQYAREMMTGCGRMILGSDSHTRYGALGTMGVGEGGPELVKQLLEQHLRRRRCRRSSLVYLTGEPAPRRRPAGRGAIALCGAVYDSGFVKNKVLEFAGPGVASLPMDYRIGIDVMTTETACLSSIWQTDEKVEEYLAVHGRPEAYQKLDARRRAPYYDSVHRDRPLEDRADGRHAVPPVRRVHDARACRQTPRTSSARPSCSRTSSSAARSSCISPTSCKDGEAPRRSGRHRRLLRRHVRQHRRGRGHSRRPEHRRRRISPCRSIRQSMPDQPGADEKRRRSRRCSRRARSSSRASAARASARATCRRNDALSIRHTTRNFPNREGSKPGERPARRRRADGCALHRGHGAQRRRPHRRDGDRLRPCPRRHAYAFDGGVYQKRVLLRLRQGRPERGASLRPEHHRMAEDPGAAGKPAHGAGLLSSTTPSPPRTS